MFDTYVEQLKNKDAAKRREAIIALGKLGDPRALSHLAQLYKTDSDPMIKELALKAGRHLQKLKQDADRGTPTVESPAPIEAVEQPRSVQPNIVSTYTKPVVSKPAESIEEPPASAFGEIPSGGDQPSNLPSILANYTRPQSGLAKSSGPGAVQSADSKTPEINLAKPRPAKEQDVKKAQQLLKNAMDAKLRGKEGEALSDLARAIRLHPDLAKASSAQGLAAALVGGSGPDAINVVLERADHYEKNKPKAAAFDPELIGMILALGSLLIAIGIFTYAFIACLPVLFSLPYILQNPMTINDISLRYSSDYIPQLTALMFNERLGDFLRQGAIFVASTFFQIMVIYIIGILFGGSGIFIRFMRVQATMTTIFYLALSVPFGVWIVALVSRQSDLLMTVTNAFLPVLFFGSFLALIIQAFLVKRIQKLSFVMAFISVILGSIVAGIIAGVLGLFRDTQALR